MIYDVSVVSLKIIPDERGKIMHMLRCDDQHFEKFGEVYFSWVYPGVIKGWHLHNKMTLNYAVPVGMIKLVLYDGRKKSPTYEEVQELFIGEDNYVLVKIPPGVWNGFKGIGTKAAMVVNCATIVHDPEEIIRKSPFSKDIPYKWELEHE